jgi:hypothetical protein
VCVCKQASKHACLSISVYLCVSVGGYTRSPARACACPPFRSLSVPSTLYLVPSAMCCQLAMCRRCYAHVYVETVIPIVTGLQLHSST